MEEVSQIKQFFNNQTVFLTGGSGFLGKVLIEKMLRECKEIKKIFVMMRSKKNKTPEERFEELSSYACFDRLKSENASVFKKLTLVDGDCQQPRLGLTEKDIGVLNQETTCIIHAAANVKFDQSLREASYIVRATEALLEMATSMPNLKVFVYVSTAYSNCLHPHIKEELYKPPLNIKELMSIVDALDDQTLEAITPKLLGEWPNTYVYSKSIAESVVDSYREKVPVTIVRPAIVTSTIIEPMPGWIDNFYGVSGIAIAAGLGILRTQHGKLDAFTPLVPVDYVGNCVLAAAWKRTLSNNLTIYNYVGHKKNKLTWRESAKQIELQTWKCASEKVLWYFCFKLRENKTMHNIAVIFLHNIPAYIADFFLFCAGRPRIAVKGYQRLNKMIELSSYFSARHWEFDDDNVMQLWSDMVNEDKKLFPFDMEKLQWNDYFYNTVMGGRLHLLKEPPDTVEKGRKKLKILFVVHYAVIAILWYLLYKILMFVYALIF